MDIDVFGDRSLLVLSMIVRSVHVHCDERPDQLLRVGKIRPGHDVPYPLIPVSIPFTGLCELLLFLHINLAIVLKMATDKPFYA